MNRSIEDSKWFQLQQPLLKWMANTDYGRDLLGLPKDFPKIVKITENSFTGFLGHKKVNGKKHAEFVSKFYSRQPIGNRVRKRWKEFQEYAQFYYDQLPTGLMIGFPVTLTHGRRFTSSNFSPSAGAAFPVDGSVNKVSGVSWAAARDAATGDTAVVTGADGWAYAYKDASNWNVSRFFTVFDTAATISAGATKSSGTWVGRVNVKDDAGSHGHLLIKYTGTTNNVTTADFSAVDLTTAFSASAVAPASGNDFTLTLNASALAAVAIGGSGSTGLAVVAAKDQSNTAPTNDGNNDAVNQFSADNGATIPVLTIVWSLATTSKNLLLLGVG
jgi:hypothetical protein